MMTWTEGAKGSNLRNVDATRPYSGALYADTDNQMARFPRLLIASVSACHEQSLCTLALLAAFRNLGYQVQHFRSLAAFTPLDYVTPLTGLASRHLDPWIMSGDLCREMFVYSASQADLSIVEGCPIQPGGRDGNRGWPEIAQLLDCPTLGIVPGNLGGPFHAPPLPAPIDALFIDQVPSAEKYREQKAALEGIYGKPVLGGLAAGKSAAGAVQKMRCGQPISGSLLQDFSRRIVELSDLQAMLVLARSRTLQVAAPKLFRPRRGQQSMRVAVAYDDCFHCYFPETLDALEYLGARLCEFSPLADERLPDASDVVFLGCGHPEEHASALAENECMRAALRQHVCEGHRVYAEGGGAAYLCQNLRSAGSIVPMVGILPADAEFTGQPLERPQPVELMCQRANWIAGPGETVRGYRNGAWRLHSNGGSACSFASDCDTPEILVRHHCVASTVHVNFAAQPRVLEAFFAAHAPSLSIDG
jgi:cobyrinic acid a,c-diamide synthase